jgi:hypothetical protein
VSTFTLEPRTMRIAVFHRPKYDYLTVAASDGYQATDGEHVRLTEYVDVTFPPAKRDDVIAESIRAIDAERAEVVAKFSAELSRLDERKSELLALPAPATEVWP